MKILKDTEIYSELIEQIQNVNTEVTIVSAFCSLDAFKRVDSYISSSVQKKRLLVRMRLADIIYHACDLELYTYCKKNNWSLYFDLDLHAKMFLMDNSKCILGSANLTNRGLGIGKKFNQEMAVSYGADEDTLIKVKKLFASAVKMTDNIYEKMKLQCSSYERKNEPNVKWGNEIEKLFESSIQTIFMSELPKIKYTSLLKAENVHFLGNVREIENMDVENEFSNCKAYRWLLEQFQKENTNELYFGKLSALLHEVLISEPLGVPGRKEVKELLANLLDWVDNLMKDEILVDVPRHSMRVRLK